jgi:uncharacterized protein (TIGR02147 family)
MDPNQIIWDFGDYRAFLKAVLDDWKTTRKHFSLRWFADRAGFSSHSFVGLVIAGKRNLGPDGAEKVARIFKLKGPPLDYFRTLVRHNQAETSQEREETLEAMKKARAARDARKLGQEHWRYYDRWETPAVRELAAWSHDGIEPAKIGEMFVPPLKADRVREALDLLLELGLLRRDGERWIADDAVVTATEVPGQVLREARTQYLLRAIEASERLPPNERHASWAVLSTSRKTFEEVQSLLDEARQKCLAEAVADPEVDGVYVVSLQAFPIARIPRESRRRPG